MMKLNTREDFRGRPIKILKLDREHKKIRSFQARPLKFRRAQGAGFNKHHFNTNSLIKKIMMDKQTTIPLSYLQNT